MPGDRNEPTKRTAQRAIWQRYAFAAVPLAAIALTGCGSSLQSSLSSMNIFDSNKATTTEPAAGEANNSGLVDNADIDCPGVTVRTGAATLAIGAGGALKEGESEALNLRYQGTITRTARECNVSGGVMTMRVGIEGRIITGPAGTPGKVDVPLRIAVVQEGVTPKAITSKFTIVPVEITSAIDRVNFTHIEEGVSFPLPVPGGLLENYVVYVGFDTLSAQQQKRPAPRRNRR